ncbi:MAG TPA: WD40 repeat domain-containing protein [Methanothrix sp.]|nr:WD40 repeat domain-containing protein [Methanothrix sp.]
MLAASNSIIQGVVIFSIISLALAGVAYDKMREANDRKEEALARSLASQSEQMRDITGSLTESVLLAIESLNHKETLEGSTALRRSLALQPRIIAELQHNSSVNAVAFSPDGRKVATASYDNTARLWDVETGKQIQRLEHDGSVYGVAFSPDGKKLATASSDSSARLWDVRTGKQLQRLEHDRSVNAVAFSPDGQKLATASSDSSARLWDVRTGKQLQRLEHDRSVNAVAFSPDGQKLATASDDKTACIWTLDIRLVMEEACSRLAENITHEVWSSMDDPDSDCLTCPAEGSFNRSSIWPWERREFRLILSQDP